MIFNSLVFAIFFPVVYAGYLALRHREIPRNVWLVLASWLFYGWWDFRFLGLLILSSLVAYVIGLGLEVPEGSSDDVLHTRKRKLLITLSLCSDLGLLGFFKYYDFLAGSFSAMLGSFGLSAHLPILGLVLPVGISFYTFQTLSYTIDVYRGRIPAERSFLNFSLYVAFFPQLVAGPIERASHLLGQLRGVRPLTQSMVYEGIYLMAWGLFKKVVIADNVSKVADAAFGSTSSTGLDALLGVYAFAIQIYCDFSGNSDVARGCAKAMGYDLMLNFHLPYFAVNPSDFWQRWHISLSTWLRDYLYIPLGGNRDGTIRTYRNLMLTMLLGGLWHGAAWTFIAWGFYHGLLLCVHRALRPWLERVFDFRTAFRQSAWRYVRIFVFFHLVCVSWLLFRAKSGEQILQMLGALGSLATNAKAYRLVATAETVKLLVPCAIAFMGVQFVQWKTNDLFFVFKLPVPVRALVYTALWLGFIFFGEYDGGAFIYFQF